MLTCIARPKKLGDDSPGQPEDTDPTTNASGAKTQAIRSLTSQVRSTCVLSFPETLILSAFLGVVLVTGGNYVISAQGHGVEGLGSVPELQPLHRASAAGQSTQGNRRVGRRVRAVQVDKIRLKDIISNKKR